MCTEYQNKIGGIFTFDTTIFTYNNLAESNATSCMVSCLSKSVFCFSSVSSSSRVFIKTSWTLFSERYRKGSKRKNLTPISVGEVRSGKTHEL